MQGPIDFIIVGFVGNKFDGSILKALGEAIDSGTIALVSLSVIAKDSHGTVTTLNLTDLGDDYVVDFVKTNATNTDAIQEDDVNEASELLENDTAAGLLIVEHLWAKPLKKAILDTGGFLIADGRIHPEAANELATAREV